MNQQIREKLVQLKTIAKSPNCDQLPNWILENLIQLVDGLLDKNAHNVTVANELRASFRPIYDQTEQVYDGEGTLIQLMNSVLTEVDRSRS